MSKNESISNTVLRGRQLLVYFPSLKLELRLEAAFSEGAWKNCSLMSILGGGAGLGETTVLGYCFVFGLGVIEDMLKDEVAGEGKHSSCIGEHPGEEGTV